MHRLLPALLLVACADTDTDTDGVDPCDDLPAVTWGNWAEGFFTTYCTSCHSGSTPDRRGAPEGMDFDTHEQVWGLRPAIRQAVLVDETMPLGGGMHDEDRELLGVWLDCGLAPAD